MRDLLLGILLASMVWGYLSLQAQINGLVTVLRQAQQQATSP